MKTVFIDFERCIGCKACEFACAVEHAHSRDPVLAPFQVPTPRTRIHVDPGPWPDSSLPNRCRHCHPAPCQDACPTGAIRRDAEYDVVLADPRKCIACALCAMVCPFDAVTFHLQNDSPHDPRNGDGPPPRVTAVKCDGCLDRLRRGKTPACVEACKTRALVFGELNDLIRANRMRQGAAMPLPSTAPDASPPIPDTVAAWRGWGVAVAAMAGRSPQSGDARGNRFPMENRTAQ
uniref:Carbon-monoxide dehydrogenase iron sulfur subunit n=1 Tax=Candidatus Kentrum eta TaxID=2126337 RepID=A0A450V2G8_9GAMM|nr:MAG: carbon-monoxide dehydrogenase iron sulfur subunit [Candidatus Kentron sp. H]VFJ99296.1 MAG: carbon-monoxide dehydrogenase iron sulfur subunit [Candidatus Kentron sp. H]VFK03764.1 MAG: carbon-monoxide dehydrogenase iron sulfur subunit [Candidatus Kentron sp. H]